MYLCMRSPVRVWVDVCVCELYASSLVWFGLIAATANKMNVWQHVRHFIVSSCKALKTMTSARENEKERKVWERKTQRAKKTLYLHCNWFKQSFFQIYILINICSLYLLHLFKYLFAHICRVDSCYLVSKTPTVIWTDFKIYLFAAEVQASL